MCQIEHLLTFQRAGGAALSKEDTQVKVIQATCGPARAYKFSKHLVGQHKFDAVHSGGWAIVNAMHRAWGEDHHIASLDRLPMIIAKKHTLSREHQEHFVGPGMHMGCRLMGDFEHLNAKCEGDVVPWIEYQGQSVCLVGQSENVKLAQLPFEDARVRPQQL